MQRTRDWVWLELAFVMAILAKLRPDLMGFADRYDGLSGQLRRITFTIEVKKGFIKHLGGLFQDVKYGMLFNTDLAILVSTDGLTYCVRDYLGQSPELLTYLTNGKTHIATLDPSKKMIRNWIPQLAV